MIGVADWNKDVPRNLVANLEYRKKLLLACRDDEAKQRAMREACRQDLVFYVDSFVWQYNPKKKKRTSEYVNYSIVEDETVRGPRVAPFILWEFQEEAMFTMLDHVLRGEDLLIEKSRDMGASWMILILFKWLQDFHYDNKFLMMSRNAELVESDDEDSLFWKMQSMYEREPTWLSGYVDGLKGDLKRRKMYFGQRRTGSSTTGTASTGKAGVGGRATAMGIDEYSQIREDAEVNHRTTDTTDCRIFNGTHLGTGTEFYQLSVRPDMKKLRLHWTQHPMKNDGMYRINDQTGKVEFLNKRMIVIPVPEFEYPPAYPFVTDGKPTGGPWPGVRSPWYDMQCKRKNNPRAIAMDLDIDPAGSESEFFNAVTLRTLKETYCEPAYWQGDLQLARDGTIERAIRSDMGLLKVWSIIDGRGLLPPGRYAAGADIAAGSGATPSCLSVYNVDTREKVIEYANANLEYFDFARMVVGIMNMCKGTRGAEPLLCWEKSGLGIMFGKHVKMLGYRNVYLATSDEDVSGKKTHTLAPGWDPSAFNAKRKLLEDYKLALQGRQLINRSKEALEECRHFNYDGRGEVEHAQIASKNDPTGARENHADRVIADAIGWMMCLEMGLTDLDTNEKYAEEISPLSLAWRRLKHDQEQRFRSRY